MPLRETLAFKVAPLFLRLALGATFIYAGHAKIFVKMPCNPDQLSTLANMGVSGAIAAATPSTSTPPPTPTPTTPANPRNNDPANPLPEPSTPPSNNPSSSALVASSSVTGRLYTPADFESDANLPMLYQLALTLRTNSQTPVPDANGNTPIRLWPASLGQDAWPVRFAWAVAITELAGGCLVLIGFLSRLSALALAGVMLGALWLATIGPAINAPKAFLAFLPQLSSFEGWHSLMLQLSAFACAIAVACLGAGWLSVDSFVFGSSRSSSTASSDEDDDE
ncbi:MAG: DoxX family protein [Phycisphaerales bacterium]